ncbi:MAG: hypothetical protein H7Z72_21910 [Bacteroidetes bacterium]|nr:hypothetical protein [Fibrella sp.]
MRLCLLIWLLPWTTYSLAQSPILLRNDFQKIPLQTNLTYTVDSVVNQSLMQIRRHFVGSRVPAGYPNFSDSPYTHWIRFQLQNVTNSVQTVSLITKGIDSLQTSLAIGDSIVQTLPLTGSHTSIYRRERLSPYLSNTFTLQPQFIYTVWIRIRNVHYRLAMAPFDLYEAQAGERFLFRQHFLYSLFIGGMALILLFSLALTLYFRSLLYLFYLGCIACALAIMLVYNDYTYLLTDELPLIVRNKNIFGILSSLVPVLYLLFVEQFLEIDPVANRRLMAISRIIIGLQFICLAIFIYLNLPLFDYRGLFYAFMGILSGITLFYVGRQLLQNFFLAKLFLAATIPVTISVILEIATNIHQIPVQDIHNLYYLSTLIELILLMWGIVYRLKRDNDERLVLKTELITIEVKAQGEERDRIADQLHNDVGSLMVASLQQVGLLRQLGGKPVPSDDWSRLLTLLNSVYDQIRDLSHQLANSSHEHNLVTQLVNKYKGIDMIDFYHEGMEQSLDPNVKIILFSVISELISNALKHAQCATINVQLVRHDDQLTILIEDNGIGFDVGLPGKEGHGLQTCAKRIRNTLKGSMLIDSKANRGTVIILKIRV